MLHSFSFAFIHFYGKIPRGGFDLGFASELIYFFAGTVDKNRFWKARVRLLKMKKYNPLRLFYMIYYIRAQRKTCSYFPLSAKFAEQPDFPHNISGVFISKNAVIGDNCVIFHQVTVGANTLESSPRFGSPVIGNNCYIGAGAKIIGNIRIGDNVRIGANCVVTSDLPDNVTVVCEKPRIIIRPD